MWTDSFRDLYGERYDPLSRMDAKQFVYVLVRASAAPQGWSRVGGELVESRQGVRIWSPYPVYILSICFLRFWFPAPQDDRAWWSPDRLFWQTRGFICSIPCILASGVYRWF